MGGEVAPTDSEYAGPFPFSFTRVVKWGDCDPAGIVYTPKVLDYAMEIVEAWFREVLGVSWLRLNREMDMGAPTVRAELDFLNAPSPDQEIVVRLRVERLGRSSITFAVTGRDDAGPDIFRAKLVSCLISRPDFKAAELPGEFRDRILAYQKACGGGEG
jgi:4-hydroxybenzoyl-CoA thioesterase